MNKKGDFPMETVGKLLVALAVLLLLLAIMWLGKEKIMSLIESLTNILRFGK
ncbi:MAG: hypothetical protein PHF86_09175 [Candidatus Nanoarchaeia archaeon]|nr:hypothetical protein [Candidatus Nanoarchaeia archaeon]